MHTWITNQMRDEIRTIDYEPGLIMRMREIGTEDLDAAADKYYKATEFIEVIGPFDRDVFEGFIVQSGPRTYEIARLGFFYFCTCKDFEHSHTACKHIYLTFPTVCRKCFAKPVASRGRICAACEQDNAPYLPPSVQKKPERIGSIRI